MVHRYGNQIHPLARHAKDFCQAVLCFELSAREKERGDVCHLKIVGRILAFT